VKSAESRDAGFDYVELPTEQMAALTDGEFERLKQRVRASGLRCETSNNLFPASLRLTGPDVEPEKIRRYAEYVFSRDSELHVEYCVFGSGQAKNIPAGTSPERAFDQVVQMLRAISPIADSCGIGIVIEPMRKAECNMINTFAEGVALARAVNMKNVNMLVDYYHLSIEHEPVQHLLDNGGKYLRHVHFSNPNGRVFPAEIGESDYRPFIDALHAIGYDGRVSCEAYSRNFLEDARRTREFFARYF
jgi:D-psicose/D-tagatose/L-ribulose 3-epimerase